MANPAICPCSRKNENFTLESTLLNGSAGGGIVLNVSATVRGDRVTAAYFSRVTWIAVPFKPRV